GGGGGGGRDGAGLEPRVPRPLGGRAERGGAHVADDYPAHQVGPFRGELPGGQRAHRVADEDGRAEAELLQGGLGAVHVGVAAEGGPRGLLAAAVAALVEGDGPVPLGQPAGGGRSVRGAAQQTVQ